MTPSHSGLVETVARAINNAPTAFDGDPVGVHLANSMMIDASTTTAEESQAAVMRVCEDAARAAIRATLEWLGEKLRTAEIEVTNEPKYIPPEIWELLKGELQEDFRDLMTGYLDAYVKIIAEGRKP